MPIRLRTILIGSGVVAIGAVVLVTLLKPDPDPCAPGDATCPIPPPPCERVGTRDLNPSDREVEPRHTTALAPPAPGGRMPFGFNDSAYLVGQVSLDQDLQLHRDVGSRLWRFPLDWATIQPDPDRLDLEESDQIYCAAIDAGVRPLFHLSGIPGWAAGRLTPCEVPCLRPPDPDQYGALRRFAELIASRYPQAAAVEAWNEPNLTAYWHDGPDPGRYVEVLREIYLGVKDGNPEMPVLGGALSNNPTDTAENLSLHTFLEGMVAANAGAYMDALSIHAYPTAPLGEDTEQFEPALEEVRSLAATAENWPQRAWVTETGMATPPGAAFSPPVPEEEQASTNLEIYERLEADGTVDAVLFHTLVEPDPALIPGGSGFGWVSSPEGGLQPKLVYCVFGEIAGTSTVEGC